MKISPRKFRSVLKLTLATVVAATLGFGQALIGTSAANAADIGSGVTNVNVTIEGPDLVTVGWGQRFTMNGSLSLPGSANPGDTFTWKVPRQISWQKDVTLEVDGVKMIDVVIEGDTATFTLRPEVASVVDRTVGFSFSGRFKSDPEFLDPSTQVLQVIANGVVVASKTVTTRKPPPQTAPVRDIKQLWFNRDDECRQDTLKCLTTNITLKAGDRGIVKLVDPAGDNWRFNCDTLSVQQNFYTADGVTSNNAMGKVKNLECTETSLNLEIDTSGTADNSTYRINLLMSALVPGETGLVTYDNEATLETPTGPIHLEHSVQSSYVGGYVIGSSIRIRKIDAAGNDANEKTQAVELPSGATKLKYAVVNNGDQPLTDVRVADEVKVGNAKVKNLKCVFPDKTEGTEWAGPFKPQATFNCSAELSEVVGYHNNEAKVTVTGVNHEDIARTDPYWAHKHEQVAVGNKVWIDANRNGKLDEGEPGKGDVTLTISRSDGQPVTAFDGSAYTTTTATSADGDYMFENLSELPADVRYVVSITYPAGYVATKPNVGGDEGVDNNSSTDSATSTKLTNDGDKDLTLDFGLVKPLVSVGDRVWWDVNRNGQQDEGEKPVKGVVVKLYDAAGTEVSETTTNDQGFYSFTNLIGGDDYTIEFVAPKQTAFTTLDTVADDVDSDANPATGKVSFTVPAAGGNSAETPDNPTIDAGLLQLNLQLSKKLATEGTVLPGGEVVFTLTPKNEGPVDAIPGWSVTDVLPAGLTLTGMTGEGYTCDTATANCVADEVLAAGATGKPITVTATVNADATGTLHNVAYVAPHDTEIAETNPLAVPTTGTDTDSTETDNDAQADLVITPLVSVGDHVWWDTNRDGKQSEGEKPVAGVTVKLYSEAGEEISQTTTSESGFYSFTNLTAGAKYTVEFVAPKDTAFTTKDAAADEVDSDADPATGKVSFTAPNSGDNSATKPDNATLDAGLLQLNLTLTKQLETKGAIYPGDTVEFTLTPKNDGPVDAIAGWSVTDVLPKGLTVKSISGDGYTCDTEKVSCVAEAGLAAGQTGKPVTVTATVNADATGTLHNVAYVAPHKNETAETNPLAVPTTGTDTDSTETDNDAQADLMITPLVSVGDYVWWDVNRNGQQDEGEKPVEGVTVKLYDADGKQIADTKTDKDGFYSFTNLKANLEYSLEFVKPADTFFTTKTTGAAETDSDADPATGKVSFTAPATGNNSAKQPDNATLDAGLLQLNLTLTKQLETKGTVLPGDEVVFTLTPANEGPVDALAGWSVTDVLPKGLTFKRIIGDGYICDVDNVKCTAEGALAAGQTGKPVTVTAVIDAGVTEELHNVAYVEPSDKDIAETNPLGDKPATGTNTDETKTDNDAQARVKVSVPVVPEKPGKPKLAMTGAEAPAFAGIAVVMLIAGVALITRSRRTVS